MPAPSGPPGQRIAVAHDAAFGFAYTHMLEGWQTAGAEILPFSPLANAAPDDAADFIFLPGGYPELHLPTLSANAGFLESLRSAAADRGIGFMASAAASWRLATSSSTPTHAPFQWPGLLSLETSFAQRKLHLGYRCLTPLADAWPGPDIVTGHEFHYTTALRADGQPLFTAQDAAGRDLGEMGLRVGIRQRILRACYCLAGVCGPATFRAQDMGVRGIIERTVPKGFRLIKSTANENQRRARDFLVLNLLPHRFQR